MKFIHSHAFIADAQRVKLFRLVCALAVISLFRFKQKFRPHWESRYIVTATTLGLLRVAFVLQRLVSQ